MRDDVKLPNLGQGKESYDHRFFWNAFRSIETFANKLLTKGPISASTVEADEVRADEVHADEVRATDIYADNLHADIDGAGITNLNASELATGTVPSARMSGAYPGITGVGTITSGTWNGSTIAIARGGTSATTAAQARINLAVPRSERPSDFWSSGAADYCHFTTEGYFGTNGSYRLGIWNGWRNSSGGWTRAQTLDGLDGAAGVELQGTGNIAFYGQATTPSGTLPSTMGYMRASDNLFVWYGSISASFSGSGAALTGLNASNLSTGTVPNGRLAGAYTGIGSFSFGSSAGDKLILYSNAYGLGIESGTLTSWGSAHRWRIGGTSVSTGTERMYLSSSALNVSVPAYFSGRTMTLSGADSPTYMAFSRTGSGASSGYIGATGGGMTLTADGTSSIFFTIGSTNVGSFVNGGDFNVARDLIASRYIYGSYTSMTHSATTRSSDTVFYSSTDNFIRKNTAAGFKQSLGISDQGVAKAWVNFNGQGVVAIRDSFNVSSITDNGTGNYTINFATSMPNANYTVVMSSRRGPSNINNIGRVVPAIWSLTTSGANIANAQTFQDSLEDPDILCAAVFGD